MTQPKADPGPGQLTNQIPTERKPVPTWWLVVVSILAAIIGFELALIGATAVTGYSELPLIPIPWGIVLAVLGNGIVTVAAGAFTGRRTPAAAAIAGWIIAAIICGTQRSNGSLILLGTSAGTAFLFAGSLVGVIGAVLGPALVELRKARRPSRKASGN